VSNALRPSKGGFPGLRLNFMARSLRIKFAVVVNCASTIALLLAVPTHAQTAAATSGREPLGEHEIGQRQKLNQLMARRPTERDEVIRELIDERRKIVEARKSGVDLSSAKIDAAFAELAAHMHATPEWMTRALEEKGVKAESLKYRIRADMAEAGSAGWHYHKSVDPSEKYRAPYYKHQDPPFLW
jgi:peptidyl-prolyl cis-trans isomerase SurA